MSSDGDKAAARDHKAHDLLILLPTRHNPLCYLFGSPTRSGNGGMREVRSGSNKQGGSDCRKAGPRTALTSRVVTVAR